MLQEACRLKGADDGHVALHPGRFRHDAEVVQRPRESHVVCQEKLHLGVGHVPAGAVCTGDCQMPDFPRGAGHALRGGGVAAK